MTDDEGGRTEAIRDLVDVVASGRVRVRLGPWERWRPGRGRNIGWTLKIERHIGARITDEGEVNIHGPPVPV